MQRRRIRWGFDDNGQNGCEVLRAKLRAIFITCLSPTKLETIFGCANHTSDIDRHAFYAELRKGIIILSVCVEGDRRLIRGKVISAEPVLPNNNWINRDRAGVTDKAASWRAIWASVIAKLPLAGPTALTAPFS